MIENPYIYGGLSHIELDAEAFELGRGVVLERTYAHFMSAHLMAFSPAPPGGYHPSPWRAAKGGLSYDIEVELSVPTNSTLPGNFSPEDTIWWIAALLRLAKYPFLIVPIISDQPFLQAAHSENEPILRPFEIEPRLLKASEPNASKLDPGDLEWVKKKWESGADLMNKHPRFQSAFRAFDICTIQGRTSASLLAVWGALEQMFSPSPGELRYRVSSNIAAYLEPPGAGRLDLYKNILELYNKRSRAAHTAEEIDIGPLVESYIVMRNAFVKMVDTENVPTQEEFESLLFRGTPKAKS